jgi:hypothetical protein
MAVQDWLIIRNFKGEIRSLKLGKSDISKSFIEIILELFNELISSKNNFSLPIGVYPMSLGRLHG